MAIKFSSISTKLILPVIGVFCAGVIALIFIIPPINKQSSLEMAVKNAESTIDQYKTLKIKKIIVSVNIFMVKEGEK